MGFGHLEIFAADPERSRDFYERVLGFEPTAVQPGGFLWLEKGGLEILIRPGRPPASAPCYEGCGVGLVLYTSRLGATLDELRARGLEIRGTVDSDRCFYRQRRF